MLQWILLSPIGLVVSHSLSCLLMKTNKQQVFRIPIICMGACLRFLLVPLHEMMIDRSCSEFLSPVLLSIA